MTLKSKKHLYFNKKYGIIIKVNTLRLVIGKITPLKLGVRQIKIGGVQNDKGKKTTNN